MGVYIEPVHVDTTQLSLLVCLGNASDCLEAKEQLFNMSTGGRTTWEFYWLILTVNTSPCSSSSITMPCKALGQEGELFLHIGV